MFRFGQYTLPAAEVFLQTKYTLGIVNLKPLVPGHVLLLPIRCVERFADMTAEEVCDLYLNVQKVGKVIEKEYGGQSLTISMQDGKAAGQSVYHVHVHILPRKPGDWMNNDDIYTDLAQNEKDQQKIRSAPGVDNDDRPPRDLAEMTVEADRLKALLSNQ